MVKRRVTLMLVGEARDFDIAKLKLPYQAIEHHQSVRPLDGIVVEMSVSRKNYVDPEGWELRSGTTLGKGLLDHSAKDR
jgi:hypothetical protein